MSWTNDDPIRVVTSDRVAKPHYPQSWTCDPCAPAHRRFRVNWGGNDIDLAWWQVITSNDSARDRFVKFRAAQEATRLDVMNRKIKMYVRDAELGYRDLDSAMRMIKETVASA